MLFPGQAALDRMHGIQLGLNVRRDEGPEGPQHRLVLDLQPCPLVLDPGNKRLERLSWSWVHGVKRSPALRRREAPSIFDHRLRVQPRIEWATLHCLPDLFSHQVRCQLLQVFAPQQVRLQCLP